MCACGQLPTICLLAVKDHFYCLSFHHYEPNLDINLFIIHNGSINNSNSICLALRILAFSFSFPSGLYQINTIIITILQSGKLDVLRRNLSPFYINPSCLILKSDP